MKRNDRSPQAYCEDVTGEQRKMLERIRALILEIVDGQEEIEYGMLAYPKVAHLAAQKHHVSVYVNPAVMANYRDAFPGVSCGKSCLRFTKPEQINDSMLCKMFSDAKQFGETG